jgi:endoribonuclease Dicer
LVHDTTVAGPFHSGNMSLSKGLASERALEVLKDPASLFSLSRLCDCGKSATPHPFAVVDELDPEEEAEAELLDDGTEEGFAVLSHLELQKTQRPEDVRVLESDQEDEDDEEEWDEQQEVEAILAMETSEG